MIIIYDDINDKYSKHTLICKTSVDSFNYFAKLSDSLTFSFGTSTYFLPSQLSMFQPVIVSLNVAAWQVMLMTVSHSL